MPRAHKNEKQKNRKFKGATKVKKLKEAKTHVKTKLIAKRHKKTSIARRIKIQKSQKIKKITEQNEYLDITAKTFITQSLSSHPEVKIVLLIPFNPDANAEVIHEVILNYFVKDGTIEQLPANSQYFRNFLITPAKLCAIKGRIHLICPRLQTIQQTGPFHPNLQYFPRTFPKDVSSQLMEIAKIADFICPILSCRSANAKRINIDPINESKAFDEKGYQLLGRLRSFGLPQVVGIVQDLQLHPPKDRDKIERLFRRFLTSEFGQDEKVVCLTCERDIVKLLMAIETMKIKRQEWKNQKGFMLIDRLELSEGKLTIFGNLKGNCINANQIVHIGGQMTEGNFQMQKIEIIKKKQREMEAETEPLVQYSTIPDDMEGFAKPETICEDILTAMEGLKLECEQRQQIEHEIEVEEDEEDEEDEKQSSIDPEEYFATKEEERNLRKVQLQMRGEDELQFEDEVEYAAEQKLREKFRDYQGLKNFKTSEWNNLENLPDEYDRIFTFKHYQQTYYKALQNNLKKGYAYPGCDIAVTLKLPPTHTLHSPLSCYFNLEHECKITLLHLKLRRNAFCENHEDIHSNGSFKLVMGLKTMVIRPIFSKVINGTSKTKFVKRIRDDYQNYYYCSFYGQNYFGNVPAVLYNLQGDAVMNGNLAKCDPLHVTLERILLTGYPFKITKRRSTIRFMFFDPKDVKYFKPVELRTKMGLRGRIEDSLGTHGLMKCMFSDKIKHNDTVYMALYRRVFPAWTY